MTKKKIKYDHQSGELKIPVPTPAGMENENVFRVPDHFFEEQQLRIKEKVSNLKSTSVRLRLTSLITQPRYSVSLLAITTAIIILLSVFLSHEENRLDYFSGITLEQLMKENPEWILSIEESELIEMLYSNSEIFGFEVFNLEKNLDPSIQEAEIIEFLINEDITIESLYN
jgi:hypothetical protein